MSKKEDVEVKKEDVKEIVSSKEIISDLVYMIIRGNNLVVKGLFQGAIADEVTEYLADCKKVHDKFVDEKEACSK